MLYLSGGTPPNLRPRVAELGWGYMLGPKAGVRLSLVEGVPWAADNGAFSGVWDPAGWASWLAAMVPARDRCLFAVVPDVLGDAHATRALWDEWVAVPRELGYRPAFVAQDGCTSALVPWGGTGALFMGGVDCPLCRWRKGKRRGQMPQPACSCFKLSEAAFGLVAEARRRGLWTHMGRVNSQRRLRAAYAGGYDSADGTYMRFNPIESLDRIGGYLTRLRRQARMEALI